MNVLAFIFGMLMLFAITTNGLLQKKLSDDVACKSFSGYMQAFRKLNNEIESTYFDKIKTIENKEKTASRPSQALIQTEKTRKPNPQNAKINIYDLVLFKEDNPHLYRLFTQLIKNLYSYQSFYVPNFEKNLANNILKALKNNLNQNKKICLANLTLPDFAYQKTYYKILKGSKFYDFDKKTGIASLLDFVKIENSNTKIPLKDASKELLSAIFNEKMTQEICHLQTQDPFKSLSTEQMLHLCKKYYLNIDENIINLFDLTNSFQRNKEEVIIGYDESTDIKLSRTLVF